MQQTEKKADWCLKSTIFPQWKSGSCYIWEGAGPTMAPTSGEQDH